MTQTQERNECRPAGLILAELIEANRIHGENQRSEHKLHVEYRAAQDATDKSGNAADALRNELLDAIAAEAGVA